ncbi:RICIN domain-containing protein [Nostoc sp. MS1]
MSLTLPTPGKDYYLIAKHSGQALAVDGGSKTQEPIPYNA